MSTAMTTAIRVLKSSNTVPAWGKTGCPGKLTDPPGIFSTHLSRGWGALQRNASAIMAAIRPSVLNQHTIEISRSVLALISAPLHSVSARSGSLTVLGIVLLQRLTEN